MIVVFAVIAWQQKQIYNFGWLLQRCQRSVPHELYVSKAIALVFWPILGHSKGGLYSAPARDLEGEIVPLDSSFQILLDVCTPLVIHVTQPLPTKHLITFNLYPSCGCAYSYLAPFSTNLAPIPRTNLLFLAPIHTSPNISQVPI